VNYFRRDSRDAKFVLFEHLGVARLLSYPAFEGFTPDDFAMAIDKAIKLGRDAPGPAMQDGDRIGCSYADGVVTTPDSF